MIAAVYGVGNNSYGGFNVQPASENDWICVNPHVEKRYLRENQRFPISSKNLSWVIELIDKYKTSGVFGWFHKPSSNPLKYAKWRYSEIKDGGDRKKRFGWWKYSRSSQDMATLLLGAHRRKVDIKKPLKGQNLIPLLPGGILERIIRDVAPDYEKQLFSNLLKKEDSRLSDEQVEQTASEMASKNYTVWLKPEELLYLAENLPGMWHSYRSRTVGAPYHRKMKISGEEYFFDSDINPYLREIEKRSKD